MNILLLSFNVIMCLVVLPIAIVRSYKRGKILKERSAILEERNQLIIARNKGEICETQFVQKLGDTTRRFMETGERYQKVSGFLW